MTSGSHPLTSCPLTSYPLTFRLSEGGALLRLPTSPLISYPLTSYLNKLPLNKQVHNIFLAASLSLLGALFPGIFLIGFSCGFSNPLTSVYVSETVGSGNKGMVTALFNCQVT